MKMRLSPELGIQKIDENEDADVLWHLVNMYGGVVVGKRQSSINGALVERYESHDLGVAAERPIHGEQITAVRIHSLELPGQAARWTALQAYKGFEHLMVDVPGTAVQQEWSRTTTQAEEEIHGQDMEFSIIPSPSVAEDEFNEWGTVRRKGPNTISTIIATGHDLPDAAMRLAEGYEKLRSRNREETPDRAVARSLGATSLARLNKIWAEAMSATTRRDAGVAAIHMLNSDYS